MKFYKVESSVFDSLKEARNHAKRHSISAIVPINCYKNSTIEKYKKLTCRVNHYNIIAEYKIMGTCWEKNNFVAEGISVEDASDCFVENNQNWLDRVRVLSCVRL